MAALRERGSQVSLFSRITGVLDSFHKIELDEQETATVRGMLERHGLLQTARA